MSEIMEVFGAILMVLGALLILISGIGILRLPDLYMRMSATAKAATLGLGVMLVGLAVLDGTLAVTGRVALTIIFLLLTAPVAAYAIGQAAYFSGLPLSQETQFDELNQQPKLTASEATLQTKEGDQQLATQDIPPSAPTLKSTLKSKLESSRG